MVRAFLLAAVLGTAAAPLAGADLTIDGPAKVDRDRLVRLSAAGVRDKAALLWRVYPPTVDKATPPAGGRVLEFAGKPRAYRIELLEITVADGVPTVREVTRDVTVTDGAAGPVDPPPVGPVDPVDPPPPSASLYFLLVRPDGPAAPGFTAALDLAEWDTLRAAGHRVKDKTASEAAALGFAVPAPQLPAVVTLREGPTGSAVVRGAVPLPTTGAGVLALPTLAP